MGACAGGEQRRARSRIPVVAAMVALSAVVAACSRGGPDAVPRSAFQTRLATRVELTPEQARCATAELYDHYGTAEIRTLYRDGLGGLPPERWTFYLQSLVGCSLGAR